MQLVHRFFDTGKKQEKVVPLRAGRFPRAAGPRTASLEDSHAKTPAFFYGCAIVPDREPDHYALELAMSVLSDGRARGCIRSSCATRRWRKRRVGWTNDHRGPDAAGLK